MNFALIDEILEVEKSRYIRATKTLSEHEDYLADHFPGNPVMPGVMVLEAMVQAAAWLLRISNDFKYSMVVLEEARNARYGKFVSPGEMLIIEARMLGSVEEKAVKFKSEVSVEGQSVASARFTLRAFNLSDRAPSLAANDEIVIKNLRQKYQELRASEHLG